MAVRLRKKSDQKSDLLKKEQTRQELSREYSKMTVLLVKAPSLREWEESCIDNVSAGERNNRRRRDRSSGVRTDRGF